MSASWQRHPSQTKLSVACHMLGMHFGIHWVKSTKILYTTNYGKRHLAQQVEPQPLSKMAVLLSHAAVQVGLPAYHVCLDQSCRLFAR